MITVVRTQMDRLTWALAPPSLNAITRLLYFPEALLSFNTVPVDPTSCGLDEISQSFCFI
jgi:hypothetical protein